MHSTDAEFLIDPPRLGLEYFALACLMYSPRLVLSTELVRIATLYCKAQSTYLR